MLNLTIEGQITSAPDKRDAKGIPVARFTVVHNVRRRDSESGKWVNKGRGLFVEIDCWRGLAERVAKLNKGDLVTIECEDDLRLDNFNGFTALRVTARNVSVSLRFDDAKSLREPRKPSGDTVVTPEGEEFDAEAYAELAAERQLTSVS